MVYSNKYDFVSPCSKLIKMLEKKQVIKKQKLSLNGAEGPTREDSRVCLSDALLGTERDRKTDPHVQEHVP